MKNQQPKPKKLPVSKVKQISDSLNREANRKYSGARQLVLKDGLKTPKNVAIYKGATNSAYADVKKAARLDSLVKAAAPKPRLMLKKTATPIKKK